jgi:hypothetical protein
MRTASAPRLEANRRHNPAPGCRGGSFVLREWGHHDPLRLVSSIDTEILLRQFELALCNQRIRVNQENRPSHLGGVAAGFNFDHLVFGPSAVEILCYHRAGDRKKLPMEVRILDRCPCPAGYRVKEHKYSQIPKLRFAKRAVVNYIP